MQASRFPTEVCERIIDFLCPPIPLTSQEVFNDLFSTPEDYTERIRALYVSSLVCKAWVHRSQHHLFHRVELCITWKARAFLDNVVRSPSIGRNVRVLAICPSPPFFPYSRHVVTSLPQSCPDIPLKILPHNAAKREETSPASPRSRTSSHQQWQSNSKSHSAPPCHYNWVYEVLNALPPLLTNLSILDLMNLPVLHPSFVCLVSRFRTIRTLRLYFVVSQSFREIIQVVNGLPQITTLHIYHCSWTRPAHFYPSKRLRLEVLSIKTLPDSPGLQWDVFNWIRSSRCLPTLRTLCFDDIRPSYIADELRDELRQCVRTLQYLSLSLGPPSNTPFDILPYIHLLALEYLKLWNMDSGYLRPFANHLSRLSFPSLKYIHFGFKETLDLVSTGAGWSDIDEVLAGNRFRQLRYLVISTPSSPSNERTLEDVQATFRKILPKSHKRGILVWDGTYLNQEGKASPFNLGEIALSYLGY